MPLIGTLTSGVSAVRTFSKGLEVIGSNIANVNTTAYKSSSATYGDTFSNTLRAATATDSAVQIGTGVQVAGISTNFTQGPLVATGNNNDLGISGRGYFVVQDATGNQFATRDGSFHFDTGGYLKNVQGYNVLNDMGQPVQVSGLKKTYDATGVHDGYEPAPYSELASVSIGSDGTITAYATDGTSVLYGRTYDLADTSVPPAPDPVLDPANPAVNPTRSIGVMSVSDESRLMRQANNLYNFSATGSTVADNMEVPGVNGTGKIQTGVLEQSNVDLTDQFSNLITTQRSFQAGSRLITVSDSVLEDIVNLKRS
ncbi:flagellar hook-basal body protein [Opitutus terrae]|uniref:Flagellar hook protein FlgE n=1 Tax=Opitutus terrae (strain DSM 11246 / JCM 15787 / PB90-1) TaxID=452637 RepID=B1ZR37_OPITP|nr:flagellar hook-basal body complex protein [Opitutus terrae]ACB73704.1 protein of unknown function DUF1078 [Opitutus terrae PB90-1]